MTEPTERERLAVLEHRADRMENLIEKIGSWMRELTAVQNTLARVETARAADNERLERLERQVDEHEQRRVEQHQQTREWLSAGEGLSKINASWIDWFKILLIAVVGGGLTLALERLF